MLGAPLGVALAHRLPAARLRRVFGLALILVAIRMAWSESTNHRRREIDVMASGR
jgi:uncharacterized membrane protein YfcA